MWYVTKTKQDNDMTDLTGLVYAENDIELSRPIRQGAVCGKTRQGVVCDETRQDNVIHHIGQVYVENDNELSRPIRPGEVCDKTR